MGCFSRQIADSGLVPDSYRKRPNDIFVAISWGMEIGLSANQALQSVAVINGKPSIYGDAGLALVRASGLLEDIHEHFTGEFGHDGYTAVCEIKRRGEDRTYKAEFSIEDAKLMGKWDKPNQNGASIWQKYPKRMLKWRARWFALRDVFGDVLNMEETTPGSFTPQVTPESFKAAQDEMNPPLERTEDDYVNPANADDKHIKPLADQAITPDDPLHLYIRVIGEENAEYGDAFAQRAADVNGCPIEDIYADAIKNPETFKSMFDKWLAKYRETAPTVEENTQAQAQPEAPEEAPSNEEVDHFNMVVGAAVNHYGADVEEPTQALLRDYMTYISSMNGMTDAQIHAGLKADPGGWFSSFEQWYDHKMTAEAEAAGKVLDNAEVPTEDRQDANAGAAETPDPDMQANLNTPNGSAEKADPPEVVQEGKISWPAFKQKWNTMPKKFFKEYFLQNVEVFKLAEDEAVAIAKRARAKWNQFYPEQPYPADSALNADEKIEASGGPGEVAGDDAEASLERRWNYINTKYGGVVVECLNKRKMASGGLTRQAKNMIIQDVLEKVGM
jgi:hypothetical protein